MINKLMLNYALILICIPHLKTEGRSFCNYQQHHPYSLGVSLIASRSCVAGGSPVLTPAPNFFALKKDYLRLWAWFFLNIIILQVECLFICLFVPIVLTNHWTQKVFLQIEASCRSRYILLYKVVSVFCLSSRRISLTAELILFSFRVKLLIGPGKVLN